MPINKGAVVVDTRLNYQKIKKEFKGLEKETSKLIDKYNKSIDSIKSQELAISKVKTKLDELMSGEKTPSNIKTLEKSLKDTEKEVTELERQYQQVINDISKKQMDLDFAQGLGITDEVTSIKVEQDNLDTKRLELATQLDNAKDKAEQLKITLSETKLNPKNSSEVQQLSQQLDVLNSKLNQTKEDTNQIKNQINETFQKKHLLKFGDGFNEIGKKIDKFRSKITKLIGAAMVFNLLRNSLTNLRNKYITLLKSNDEFSSSLNQVKANLMTAFAPIYNACLPAINSLMNALAKVTGTIAVFVSGLFGTSLENAKKQAKGLSKALDETKKSGEEASGSLASFDNLEVISDSSSSAGGSSGCDSGIDYSGEIQYSQKLLDFLNKVKEFISQNGELILSFFSGIGLALGLIKLGIDPIISLGIGAAVAGLVLTIQSLLAYLKAPTWKNFGGVLQGISLIIMGIAIAFGAWPVAIGAAVALVVATIIKYWDKIKQFLQGGIDWLKEKGREIFTMIFGNIIAPIYDACVNILQSILNYFNNIFTNIKKIFDNIIGFIKNVFTGNWQGAWDNIKNIFFTLLDQIKNQFSLVLSIIWNLISGWFKTILNGANALWDEIKNIFGSVASFFKEIFSNAWNAVKNVFSTGGKIFDGIKEGILNGFITIVNAIIDGINKVVSIPFNGINSALRKIRDISFLGVSPFKGVIKEISVPQIPQLATGAVIPPRQKFLAMLGDQKHGTNIEAPLETIKQANREVMQEFMGAFSNLNNDEKEIVFRNLTIIAQFGNKDFSKIVVEAVRMAEKEMGKQLFVSA